MDQTVDGPISASADAPAAARRGLVHNSLGMVVAKLAAMALGFVFWLVAAHATAPTEVGLVAAAVAATLLTVQIAQMGTGQAVVLLWWEMPDDRQQLIHLALRTVVVASVIVGASAVAIGAATGGDLGVLSRDGVGVALFLVATSFGSIGIVQDQLSMAVGAGHQILVRNATNGLLSLLALGFASALGSPGWRTVLGCWTAGSVAAVLVGRCHIRSSGIAGPGPVPATVATDRRVLRRQLRSLGRRNFALISLERLPGLVLPLVVIEMLSPAQNAVWYTVWQIAWAVFVVPIAIGTGHYAQVAAVRSNELAGEVRHAIRAALGLSIVVGATAAAAAPIALPLVGDRYSSAGLVPLLILILSAVPTTALQVYYALCRGLALLAEATVLAGAVAIATIAGALVMTATGGGLVGVAGVWLSCTTTGALVAAWRMSRVVASSDRGLALAATP